MEIVGRPKMVKFIPEFTTSCGHIIKVQPVLKVGGMMEGKWSVKISGPLVTGKSGIKTVYADPSVLDAKMAAAKFLRISPHLLMEDDSATTSGDGGNSPVSRRSAFASAVRKRAGVDDGYGDAGGQVVNTEDVALRSVARILVLDSLIKPLDEELKSLVDPLKTYMVKNGCDLLITEEGHVQLKSTTSMKLDSSLLPAYIVEQRRKEDEEYRIQRTTRALYRTPNSDTIINGVLKSTEAAGNPLKRKRIKLEEE